MSLRIQSMTTVSGTPNPKKCSLIILERLSVICLLKSVPKRTTGRGRLAMESILHHEWPKGADGAVFRNWRFMAHEALFLNSSCLLSRPPPHRERCQALGICHRQRAADSIRGYHKGFSALASSCLGGMVNRSPVWTCCEWCADVEA